MGQDLCQWWAEDTNSDEELQAVGHSWLKSTARDEKVTLQVTVPDVEGVGKSGLERSTGHTSYSRDSLEGINE